MTNHPSHEDPDVTIKSPPSTDLPPTVPITEKPGDRIGRYKLLERIGEGALFSRPLHKLIRFGKQHVCF